MSGIIIGEEISVAGYDGVPLGKYFDPQITTLEQDKAKIGSEAATQLISLIEDGDKAEEKVIIVPGKVFKGGTAGRVK
jgi:DNA-binding LacI/PurR family transcriptional regulator